MAKEEGFSIEDLDANLDLVVAGIKAAGAALTANDLAVAGKSLADLCDPLELLVAELAKLSQNAVGAQGNTGTAQDVAGGNCRVIVIR